MKVNRIAQLSLVVLFIGGMLVSGTSLARADDGRSHHRGDRWEERHDHRVQNHRPAENHGYRFHDGRKVVRVERVVRRLPHHSYRTVIGRTVYYREGNHFYRHHPQGYVRVRPPAGVFVSALPHGFVQVSIGGILHFRYDDVYYRPARGGYLVVDVPLGTGYRY